MVPPCPPSCEPRRCESGFTLIEVILAAFIGLIVTIMIGTLLMTGRGATDRATSRLDASTDVEAVVRGLQQDVGAMRAPDRASGAVYDPADFAAALKAGGPVTGFSAEDLAAGTTTPKLLDIQDLTVAKADEIRFALPTDGASACVHWRATADGIVRELHPASLGCAAPASAPRRRYIARATVAAPAPGISFTYVLAKPDPAKPDDGCANERVAGTAAGLVPGDLARVIAVEVAPTVESGHDRVRATAARATSIVIASRRSREYLSALGCPA